MNTATNLFPSEQGHDLVAIRQASIWASHYLNRQVTPSNISYLVQYGRINKYSENGSIFVSKTELIRYYEGFHGRRETDWKKKLGDDLNWRLSFDFLKEKDTTKHVHRLHPYKGKFIPQLVEYFLDDHTDEYKTETFFKSGDIVLDPFCGSGTTLIQANELGIHAVGVDVSAFNALISNAKIAKHNFAKLEREIERISVSLHRKIQRSRNVEFDQE
ncbi:MAG: DNA methyltransferase, partial [Candidatus Dadabacteria bacterium]|nr:DNA methyltransferase [Candidatus Dadabacteria bacterium]